MPMRSPEAVLLPMLKRGRDRLIMNTTAAAAAGAG